MGNHKIHTSAIISSDAKIGKDVEIGPYAIIEGDVKIGDGCKIGPHARVACYTTLGQGVELYQGSVVGTEPQDKKFKGEETYLEIGDRTVVREYATLNRGTGDGRGKTKVGAECLFMAYSHVAHDCFLGDGVILANCATLAGHITIGDYAIVGGLTGIHQFVHIGAYAFVGGMTRLSKDVLPFSRVAGVPVRFLGCNRIGLLRAGISEERVQVIEKIFRVFRSLKYNQTQFLEKIENDFGNHDDAKVILDFIRNSERGIPRGGGEEE